MIDVKVIFVASNAGRHGQLHMGTQLIEFRENEWVQLQITNAGYYIEAKAPLREQGKGIIHKLEDKSREGLLSLLDTSNMHAFR